MSESIPVQAPQQSMPMDKILSNAMSGISEAMKKQDPNKPLNIESMFDGVIGSMVPNMNPDTKNNFKDLLKTMSSAMEANMGSGDHPDDMKPIKGSKILLDDGDTFMPHIKEPKVQKYEILDDSEEIDEFCKRTEDIEIELNVELEELYTGTTKKFSLERNRLKQSKDGIVEITENKKFSLKILPGSIDGQHIRLSKQGHEKIGYDTGDILVVLHQNGHPRFERHNRHHLYTQIPLSLFETYAMAAGLIDIPLEMLDKKVLRLHSNITEELMTGDIRVPLKVVGHGFPIYNTDTNAPLKYGNLYINFKLELPLIKDVDLKELVKGFPPMHKFIKKNEKHTSIPVDIIHLSEEELQELYQDSSSSDDDDDEEDDEEEDEEDEEDEDSASSEEKDTKHNHRRRYN
jgi:DnaJ-class molecular chaperone